jgi:hypothetical protein
MAVSSEIPLAAASRSTALLGREACGTKTLWVEDEEFPDDLPQSYDRMLQSAGQPFPRRTARLVAVIVTAMLVVALSVVAITLPKFISPASASPASSSK